MTEPNENQSSLCFDLRVRIAAVLAEAQEAHNGISDLDMADAVIAELKLREERWKSDDPTMLRGYWTRHCTDWTPPTDGKADDE